MTINQLTSAIDHAELIHHRLQQHAERDGVGACLTGLHDLINDLMALRETACAASGKDLTTLLCEQFAPPVPRQPAKLLEFRRPT